MTEANDSPETKKGKKTLEQVQLEIAEVELQTKLLLLGQAKRSNEDFEVKEQRRREGNKRRMSELAAMRRNHEATVKSCRHKSGGSPKSILKGGGIGAFSIITRTIMPDGVTVLLQCPRCRMLLYTPHPSLKESNPKQYLKDLEIYNKYLEESQDNGLEHAEMRGPTFFFQNAQGVPVVPVRV